MVRWVYHSDFCRGKNRYDGWFVTKHEFKQLILLRDNSYWIHPWNARYDRQLKPPIAGPFESLEAAQTAYVILFEV